MKLFGHHFQLSYNKKSIHAKIEIAVYSVFFQRLGLICRIIGRRGVGCIPILIVAAYKSDYLRALISNRRWIAYVMTGKNPIHGKEEERENASVSETEGIWQYLDRRFPIKQEIENRIESQIYIKAWG
jgi:hypothetical protein